MSTKLEMRHRSRSRSTYAIEKIGELILSMKLNSHIFDKKSTNLDIDLNI